jgi:prophage regulatory protein
MKTQPQTQHSSEPVQVIRHAQVCNKLQISSAKLFDMVATGLFPKPFNLIPGGRAVGWLEHDVDQWIVSRKEASKFKEAV